MLYRLHTKPSCNSNNKLAFLQHKIKDNELLLCSLPNKEVQIKNHSSLHGFLCRIAQCNRLV